MRTRTRAPLAVALALIGTLAMTAVTMAAETTLTATLKGGDTEVPPGDPDGSGSAKITVDPASGKVCWDITVTAIAAATQSHIHVGAASAAGDVVVPLDVDGFEGATNGCIEGQDAALLGKIVSDPSAYYVNVHTADFKPGAVRGQLAAGSPNTALPVSDGSPLAALGFALLLAALAVGLRTVRPLIQRD